MNLRFRVRDSWTVNGCTFKDNTVITKIGQWYYMDGYPLDASWQRIIDEAIKDEEKNNYPHLYTDSADM